MHDIILEEQQANNNQPLQPGTLLVDYFPILERLPERFQPWLQLARRLRRRESALHEAFLGKLKSQVLAKDAPTCFGTDLINIQEAEGIDDEQAINILAMIIGAGAETTSSMLQSFFKVMAMNPKAQRRAQMELDQVVGLNRMPDWEDERRLPYLRALIKEVHRWAPIANLLIPHATSKDDIYRGRHIPKGTVVFPNVISIHSDPDVYEDPESFEPERFLQHDLQRPCQRKTPGLSRPGPLSLRIWPSDLPGNPRGGSFSIYRCLAGSVGFRNLPGPQSPSTRPSRQSW